MECRVRADAACSRERPAAVRGYFDHEPGVLALAAEVWRLDGRTGRPVLAEPLGPDLVEHGPVTLKIPHDDADRTTSVSAAPVAARIAEVVKDLFSLGPRVLGDGVVQRVVPKQRGHVDPPSVARIAAGARLGIRVDDPARSRRRCTGVGAAGHRGRRSTAGPSGCSGPAHRLHAVTRQVGVCEPDDIIANRLDPGTARGSTPTHSCTLMCSRTITTTAITVSSS
ncbi:MAG: hypothetical protein QOF25_233 [Mycobacterium sp.]|nr:hypothetical protein [Mycobacterium sp.]